MSSSSSASLPTLPPPHEPLVAVAAAPGAAVAASRRGGNSNNGAPEEIVLDASQQAAYQQAMAFLQAPPFVTGAASADPTASANTPPVPLFSVVAVQAGLPVVAAAASQQQPPPPQRSPRFRGFLHPDGGEPPPARGAGGGGESWFSESLATTRGRNAAGNNSSASSTTANATMSISQPLAQALNQLEGLEKSEPALLLQHAPAVRQLTELALNTGERFATGQAAIERIQITGQAVPRRVCQHPFRKNDIVWVCRTCQADETCVLCHECFSTSNHEGHDINFYHAQAGGCCDCGDPDAWDPAGFCPRHGPAASGAASDAASALPPTLVPRVRAVVPAVVDWMVHSIAATAEQAYRRANPKPAAAASALSAATDEEEASQAAPSDRMELDEEDEQQQLPQGASLFPGLHVHHVDEDEISVDEMDFPTAAQLNNNTTTAAAAAAAAPEAEDHHHHHPARAQVFSPTAASAARSHRQQAAAAGTANRRTTAAAADLGRLGAAGRGLYLVVHADDIHVKHQFVEAFRHFWGAGMFFSDMILNKTADALKLYGQLIVFGTAEIYQLTGPAVAHLWMDGDAVACTTVGDLILERCSRLAQHGLFCSILTFDELLLEQRAVAVLQWLAAVARSCDPLCQTVAECILPNRHLVPLLRADFKMSSRATKAWYSLLLTLLAVPTFKSHLAAAYCDTYRAVTAKYARGMGVLERSGYTLSVQFLNRVAYVVDLVQGRDLLGKLGKSLLDTLLVAASTTGSTSSTMQRSSSSQQQQQQTQTGRLDPNHFVLAHRRYSPCVSDLKCVLNVAGMPRVTACAGGTFLTDWIQALAVAQFMDPQSWRHWSAGHVEDESRGWVGAFNASISLGSLFERLLGWKDDDESPIADARSPLSRDLLSCVELTAHVLLTGVAPWQQQEMTTHYAATPFTSSIVPHRRCPGSLAFSTVAARHGTALALRQLPVSQTTPFSFHLPLHRFVASAVRELCLRPNDSQAGMTRLMQMLATAAATTTATAAHTTLDYDLFHGLMEFPVLVLSRVAQVRSDLWKRNGPGLNDQVLNYAEPPFCRNMRDADLLMAQFACLGRVRHLSPNDNNDNNNSDNNKDQQQQQQRSSDVGMAFLIHLLLHRFGIFDFCGLYMAPNSNIARYQHETAVQGLYPAEIPAPGALESDLVLPWTHSAARDAACYMKLLEEFLHFLVVFISELPHVVPQDRAEQIRQAKYRLFREVIHRLASGPKTHSELAEVHHVLSHWDNVLLNEEGRLLNPDDATGAALGVVLADVADRRVIRSGRPEPDKWCLRDAAWESYDPAFFHISLRCHQVAAENRPKPKAAAPRTNVFGWEPPRPYAPRPSAAHFFFGRLRRDATADATLVAIAYKVLHLHCRPNNNNGKDAATGSGKDLADLRGKSMYESKEMSETALARAVHLLTLGAYAWSDDDENNNNASSSSSNWRERGGGSPGSVFYHRMDQDDSSAAAPSAKDWVEACLLQDPRELLDCDWYQGEENAVQLLHRLAVHGGGGGGGGGFTAQDTCVRAGAAWLCQFAASHSPAAAALFRPAAARVNNSRAGGGSGSAGGDGDDEEKTEESEIERRKRLAKEKAMARIKAQAAKFLESTLQTAETATTTMDTTTGEILGEEGTPGGGGELAPVAAAAAAAPAAVAAATAAVGDPRRLSIGSPNHRPIRAGSFASTLSSGSSVDSDSAHVPSYVSLASEVGNMDLANIPPRLLQTRPRCIICNDEESSEGRAFERSEHDDGEGQRKKSRRKTENALGFVGYSQASTVLKGGGGPPPDLDSPTSAVREFVGVHVALCGHAVHSECCESYLATVSHREDRAIGKRDEFRCPLCQRLSNCLVPFIDVGVDWIDSPTCLAVSGGSGSEEDMAVVPMMNAKSDDDEPSSPRRHPHQAHSNVAVPPSQPRSLHDYLSVTSWWLARQSGGFIWDGHSAFVDKVPTMHVDSDTDALLQQPQKPARKMRSLKKKDLYVAWNAMMRTRRFVRRKLRARGSLKTGDPTSPAAAAADHSSSGAGGSSGEDSSGETLVWRRFMDQIADISYKADSKRLGDNHLHDLFGEFRHFIVEKYAYNTVNSAVSGRETADWPSCIFEDVISDTKRQEMSREKLLSKLLMSIQAFTYSCCCEGFEARREYRRNASGGSEATRNRHDSSVSAVLSRYGMAGMECDGHLIVLPLPSSSDDGGLQPFDGRLGKLRYLGLAIVSAAGAVSADLVQLVMPFPVEVSTMFDNGQPDRAPIAYPLLLGHVMTHVVAAMFATCGRARAQSDSIDMWQVPLSRGSFADPDTRGAGAKRVDNVADDCEGFIKLGLLARTLQVLLGKLRVPGAGASNASDVLQSLAASLDMLPKTIPSAQRAWMQSCSKLLEIALVSVPLDSELATMVVPDIGEFEESCALASEAAVALMSEIGTILQVLVPGAMARYGKESSDSMVVEEAETLSSYISFERICSRFRFETLDSMLESAVVKELVTGWYATACQHAGGNGSKEDSRDRSTLKDRLHRTQGFRSYDWPSTGAGYMKEFKGKDQKFRPQEQPHDDSSAATRALAIEGQPNLAAGTDLLRRGSAHVAFSSKKSVPLLGGFRKDGTAAAKSTGPRVTVIPTSYTDLYAELGALMPDSEQTAVCLICGEVLNAGGKGECTRHSYKCGAGAGMFFLLQECSGLIMHKSKAAYIHSPYVDSHGETPQYRGRPLNLDLDRYDHLREVWFGHGVRQQVVAERATSRQVILPDFY